MMLIWDFEVDAINSLTASQCTVRPSNPNSKSGDKSIGAVMPLLDINRVNCNCSCVRKKEKVLLKITEDSSSVSASGASEPPPVSYFKKLTIDEEFNEDEEEEEENEDEIDILCFERAAGPSDRVVNDEVDLIGPTTTSSCMEDHSTEIQLFSETFKLKGSSYHGHFQSALTEIKQKLIKEEIVPVQLHFEPVNRRGENAIVVHACLGNRWKPIGYVPGMKVAKVTHAVNNQEITKVTIDSVKYQYIWALSMMKYFASVTIMKKGRWMKNKYGYKYSEEI